MLQHGHNEGLNSPYHAVFTTLLPSLHSNNLFFHLFSFPTLCSLCSFTLLTAQTTDGVYSPVCVCVCKATKQEHRCSVLIVNSTTRAAVVCVCVCATKSIVIY